MTNNLTTGWLDGNYNITALLETSAVENPEQWFSVFNQGFGGWAIITILAIIGVVASVLLAFFITRSITKPVDRVIQGLTGGAEQVASASEQLSSSSQQLSAGASEQASSLEEISSSLEEMASMTKQNTENTHQANLLAGEADSASKHSTEAGHRGAGIATEQPQAAELGTGPGRRGPI